MVKKTENNKAMSKSQNDSNVDAIKNVNLEKSFSIKDWTKQIIFLAFIVIILIYLFYNLNIVFAIIRKIIGILTPIIIGLVLAYIMNPLYNAIETSIIKRKNKYFRDNSKKAKFAKVVATFASTIAIILISTGLIFLLVPQLYHSITSFAGRVGGYIDSFKNNLLNMNSDESPEFVKFISNQLTEIMTNMKDIVANMTNVANMTTTTSDYNLFDISTLKTLTEGISQGVFSSFKWMLNALVGLVVMIYVLNMKEELLTSTKRILYALFDKRIADKIRDEVNFADKVFSGFIYGKIIDSAIIGVICYICCLFMNMPYTILVSVIVGVTNVIPFFGPFIGAIPSFFIILLDQPFTWRPYVFVLFIFVLQQIDGNVIGPKILGDKTGVGSFWVLFSILLFGGLFGFVGMIIAVPLWAIITRLFDEFISHKLVKRGYPATLEEYVKMKNDTDDDLKDVKKK